MRKFLFFVIFIFVLSLITFGSPSLASGDIIGWWHFTNNTNDSSGNGLTITPHGTPDVSKGYLESGNVTTYLDINDDDLLSFTNGTNDLPFSLSLWVKLPHESVAYYLLQKGTIGANTVEWFLYVNTSGQVMLALYDYQDPTLTYIGRRYSQSIVSDQWQYLTATYDGSKSNSGIKLYLNGTRVDDLNNSSGTYTGMTNQSTETKIGYSGQSMSSDDIRIYNKELSLAEIQSIYNNTVDQYTPSDVEIKASIDPTLTLDLSSTNCAIGDITDIAIETCSYTTTVVTNAAGGYTGYIQSDGGFVSGSNEINAVSDGAVTYNNEEYGVGTDTTDTVGDFRDYSGTDSCSNLDGGTIALPADDLDDTLQTFASAANPVDGVLTGVTILCHGAAITGLTPAGSYSQQVTITVVANF